MTGRFIITRRDHVPVRFDYHRHGSYELVGLDGKTEYWPQTAVIATADVGNANDANGTDDSTVETAASTSAVPAGSNADQRQ